MAAIIANHECPPKVGKAQVTRLRRSAPPRFAR